MGPNRYISQAAFDAAVEENIQEFGMEEDEAIEDAIHTFKLQGVDLSGIVTKAEDRNSIQENVATSLSEQLRVATDEKALTTLTESEKDSLIEILDGLLAAMEADSSSIVLAGNNEAVNSCLRLIEGSETASRDILLKKGLSALSLLLQDDGNKQRFLKSDGPKTIHDVLTQHGSDPAVVQLASEVAATSGAVFELNKEAFMDLGTHVVLVEAMQRHLAHPGPVRAAALALKTFSTADDGRVAASKTFTNARTIAEAGGVEAILEASRSHLSQSAILSSLCLSLKSIAVNDEICKRVAENGGINLVNDFLRQSIESRDALMAASAASLLTQLAGNDSNKEAIVAANGIQVLLAACSAFRGSPSVAQEAFSTVAALALRQPGIADKALRLGAVDVAVECMAEYSSAWMVQRQACSMIRNLTVRNPENRALILEKGVEPFLRRAKGVDKSKDMASAALRDLGFDDYI